MDENEKKEYSEPVLEEVSDAEGGEEEKEMSMEDMKNMIHTVTDTLKNLETSVKIMEDQWLETAREFKVTDTHMKELGKWNNDHRTEMPEDISDEDRANWDYLNGIDSITIEEITRIFGEDSSVHGASEEITKGHVKEICETYFGWLMIMREYRQAHDAYLELLELQEETNLEVLKKNAEEETDPDKKEKMLESIDRYYKFKYLGFLAEPMDDAEIKRLVDALADEKKCAYWVNRTKDKLTQYKVSPKFIMEIAGFEKRFGDDKYASIMNILLLYFMNTCIHSDAHDKKDPNNTKTFSMIIALDDIIRNIWKDDKKERVMNNVKAFLDQVIAYKEKLNA